jgi:flagellin-like protein
VPRRKGISPVIATVIIVAVTIAVAIAVAFWMTGIVGLFTGFEQLQIVNVYDDTGTGIIVTVKNTGTSAASITDIYLNGYSYTQYSSKGVSVKHGENADSATETFDPSAGIPIKPGAQVVIKITCTKQPDLFKIEPGVSLEIKLHSAGGKDYPKVFVPQLYSCSASGTP